MALWESVFSCPPNPDIFDGEIEEEIEDETERPNKEENEEKIKGHNALEIDKETEKKNFISDSEEESLSSTSTTSYRRQKELQLERKLKAALEDLKTLRRDRVKMKEALNKERREKYALSKALKSEQAQKDTIRVEMEYTKIRMTYVKRSEKVHRERHTKLQEQIKEMTADHKSNEEIIQKLKCELQSDEDRKEELCELKLRNCEKDQKIQTLHFRIENLQSNIEAKDNTISKLKKDTVQASDLKEEQSKNGQLQRDYEAALSQQQQRDKKEQVRLEDALNKSRLADQDLRETGRILEEKLKREKGRLSRALEKIVMQRKVSAATEGMRYDMETLRLENQNIGAKYEALEAKYEALMVQHTKAQEEWHRLALDLQKTSDYHEVLKSHSTHPISYARLGCATGDLQLDVSRAKLNLGWSKIGSSFRDFKPCGNPDPCPR